MTRIEFGRQRTTRIELEEPIKIVEQIHRRWMAVGERQESARAGARSERQRAEQSAAQSLIEQSGRLKRRQRSESRQLGRAKTRALQDLADELAEVELRAETLAGQYRQLCDDLKTRCRNVQPLLRQPPSKSPVTLIRWRVWKIDMFPLLCPG